MNSWKVILATLVIFGTGVVTGEFLANYWPWDPVKHKTSTPSAKQFNTVPGAPRIEFLRRAQRELVLTAEQRERIDKIIRDGQERTKALMTPISAQLHEQLQKTRNEFREVLTPEQQARFDEFLKQEKRSHDSRRGGPLRETSADSLPTNRPAPKSPF